jgi:gluconokinase
MDASVVGHICASKSSFKNHMETNPPNGLQPEQLQHIWIITGPAGSGKTTVARGLEKELELPFLEGDDVSTTTPNGQFWYEMN